jgi:hypothetical protein
MTDKKEVDISNEGKDTDKEAGLLPQDIQGYCDSYRCNECLELLTNSYLVEVQYRLRYC